MAKALNNINHKLINIRDLEDNGARSLPHDLIYSYLSNRKQVKLSNKMMPYRMRYPEDIQFYYSMDYH